MPMPTIELTQRPTDILVISPGLGVWFGSRAILEVDRTRENGYFCLDATGVVIRSGETVLFDGPLIQAAG